MGPAFLFFSLVFLVFVNSGYILIMSPPAFAWLGVRAADWFAQERGSRPLRTAVVAVAAVLNVCHLSVRAAVLLLPGGQTL